MTELAIGPDDTLLNHILHREEEAGWSFAAGDPEFWKFAGRLVVPGGTALDVGIGWGRSSFYLASQGMHVEGYDIDQDQLTELNEMAAKLREVMPFDLYAHYGDAAETDFGQEKYDTVVVANLLHMPTKKTALSVYDRAYAALKPGGAMWVRALGKASSHRQELIDNAYWDSDITVHDDGVIEHPCGCTGYGSIDPTVFFEQTELLERFVTKGAKILYSRSIPSKGAENIMFGEDHRTDVHVAIGAMVSLLIEK
jgi:hypothetical protein